jgi:RND family efflux transporter MFP subunit
MSQEMSSQACKYRITATGKPRSLSRTGILLAVLVSGISGLLMANAADSSTLQSPVGGAGQPKGIETVTRPNYDAELSFPLQGRIGKILVKPGHAVKKGDVLVQLEDDVEQTRATYLKAQADDELRIAAARLQWEQKKLDYTRLVQIVKKGGATRTELEHARLEMQVQKLSVGLAEFDRTQAKTEYKQAMEQLKLMRIVAPVDGVVDVCFCEVGQSVDRAMKVVRLVNVDPVWIDVPTPIAVGASLKMGQKANVVWGTKNKTVSGTIIHIALVADSASETRMVRLSVPNPKHRAVGMRAWVQFPK